MANRHLWMDPFSGLSGDIWIGGRLALGVPEADLQATLKPLPFDDLRLRMAAVLRCGIHGIKASVAIDGRVDAGQTEHVALQAGARRAAGKLRQPLRSAQKRAKEGR